MNRIIPLLTACFITSAAWGADLLLAKEYRNQNIAGWAMSEKLDGVRAYWDGKRLISRQGYAFTPPSGFTAHFPPYPLDGELYSKRGQFEQISAAVRSADGNWQGIRLHVFDVPQADGNLYRRLSVLQRWLERHPNAPISMIPQIRVRNTRHAHDFLKHIEKQGGEGVMLRNPEAPYTAGRSNNLLKLKNAHDAECTVTRHYPGKGRNSGRLGAIGCKNETGEFRIGSGFKDKDRDNPPPIGATVTYRYRGFTQKGTPRFATFVRIRNER
ncbi:DNA ligase [Neisseria animalis]|uniref:DNA ligase n=1 Tax=Neisseria animalis TaxID=492 RepID=A0A5P3MQE5_NEIAN|nr:DNA ligase [Neisseria animalis]QEY23812.1 DNA ligase [Neisseria animalis]ROW31592.1 DNA ligase [Neisseria animalis]VEE09778.1 DNA ligase [Neisseria animalis]